MFRIFAKTPQKDTAAFKAAWERQDDSFKENWRQLTASDGLKKDVESGNLSALEKMVKGLNEPGYKQRASQEVKDLISVLEALLKQFPPIRQG